MRKRTNSFCVRLNDKEMKALNKNAAQSGLPREVFVRECIMNKDIYEAPPADYFELIRQLRIVGNNIDRVLQIAYANRMLDVPMLSKALCDLRETEICIRRAFGVEAEK